MDAAAGCLMGDESGCWAVAEGALSRRHLVDESRRVSEDTIPGGTTVILGGLGRVGSAIARALAARDARKIVLVARGEATDLLDDLRSLGSDVTLVCGDAADPALLRRVLAEESTPVGLVVHAAGHVADEPIARLSAEGLASVLDAKLGVAEAIDSVLEPSVPLLITSGLPGTLGVAGQAAWSAAAAAVDAVAMRRSIELNGVSALCLTKLDVLDGMDTVRICTHYDMTGADGKVTRIGRLPTGAAAVARCQPVYEDMPGWTETTRGVRRWEDLPANAQRYVQRLAEVSGAPIDIISTGPDREETIVLKHPCRKAN